jgi:hypothetical protein
MSRTVGFAYPGARIQARYGRLVGAPAWERLRRLDTAAGFLQGARDTALRPWVAQLDASSDPHALEAQLRGLFQARIAELSEWSPPEWRPAVAWVEGLPELPRTKQPNVDDWLARWRALWPAMGAAERRALDELVALLQDAVRDAARDAPSALAALQRPLRKLFRRHTRAPAGLFAYLALTWIEFAALRGALLRRRLGLPLEGAGP